MSDEFKQFLVGLIFTTVGIVIIFQSFDMAVSTFHYFLNRGNDTGEFLHPYYIGFIVYLLIGILVSNTGLKIFVKWLFKEK